MVLHPTVHQSLPSEDTLRHCKWNCYLTTFKFLLTVHQVMTLIQYLTPEIDSSYIYLDTDTPGFQEENKSKPEETKLISQGAGLFKPEEVACTLLHDGLKGKFLSSNGIDGWLSTYLCIGMAPSSLSSLFLQCCFLGLMRLVSFGYLQYFHYLIRKSHKKKQTDKKEY